MHVTTRRLAVSLLLALTILAADVSRACTSILVSRGASRDGSCYITYSADAPFMPRLLLVKGGVHGPGAVVPVWGWEDDRVRGEIPQAERTYTVVGLMNEHQVTIGETTTGGRRTLRDPNGLLDYDALILLTLQRARTAREAIQIIDALCREHGYGSSGETFSIADPHEVWMMELVGKGPDRKGIVWVAARVPDGYVSAHANMSRITTFPMDDPENWLHAEDVVSLAQELGFYDPASGKPFSWRDAYHGDVSMSSKRVCAARVWSVLRRVAPSLALSPDYHRGVDGAEPYPLFVKPDEPLTTRDVMALMRDHYEGTPFDMTQGVDAGPFGSPYRFRDLTFQVDGETYCWERPVSTQQAGFVMVSQCRSWLPDPVGGVYWFTPDDAYTSCFLPLYCGIEALPEPYAKGDHDKFSWESAWWIFNMVSNLAYDRWSRVWPDVETVQGESEATFLKLQPAIDATAAKLFAQDETLAREYLTQFSVSSGDRLFERWRELAGFILTKHNDGYVNDRVRSPRGIGYSESWLKQVIEQRGDALRLRR
ncbi:MAG: C69 family dipeptidase [Planctomycetes bacterium]|nr:C69 family dipeptidase [Planctomycetota bacterium]MCB9891812.1 C69 family dipeptidase [Planctomycetota bacterium]